MANTTRAQLRLAGRRRADQEDQSSFVSDAEWNDNINSSIGSLHAIILAEDSGSLFSKVAPTLNKIGPGDPASENALSVYQLPNDFLRLVDVAVNSGSVYLRATAADPQEYAQLLSQTYNGIAFTRYYLQWNIDQGRYELFVFPGVRNGDDKLMVRYVPAPTVLSLDTDTLNYPANWHEWVEIDTAIKAVVKEESDPSSLVAQKIELQNIIINSINDINKTGIKKIRDISYWEDRPRGPWSRFPIINYS